MSTLEAPEAPRHEQSPTLTATDRCDSCGAQAYIRVTMPSGQDLLFCAHHGNKHREKLSGQGFVWHDESYRLQGGQQG